MSEQPPAKTYHGYQFAGLLLGPMAALGLGLLPPPAGLAPVGWATAGIALLMAVWWATEAVPVAATALLPLVLFPLRGVADIGATAAPYANPLIYLFLGGFLIALGMQRWDLHRRIALTIVAAVGDRPHALVAGFMAATAILSMWVSNTATTMMMLPIAISVVVVVTGRGEDELDGEERNFAVALMLGIAYAASIGGLGTLIGTPPNALLAAFLSGTYGVEIGFARWMLLGLPLVAVLLPLCWLALVGVAYRFRLHRRLGGGTVVGEALAAMGPISPPEKRVAAVFALVAALWILRPLLAERLGIAGLSDAGIAVFGALLLFVLPADWRRREFLLNWTWARRLPFEVLVLFGGGLSLAAAVDRTGLAAWIGQGLAGLGAWPTVALIAAVVLLIIFLTELTSNTATTAAMLPVVASLAVGLGAPPLALAAPAALAASCAFMLPVATPPNAIVFGSGHVTIPQMVRAGLIMNLIGVAAITLAAVTILPLVFDT